MALKGAIAQLVERVLCKHEVVGSNPSGSTTQSDGISGAEWRDRKRTGFLRRLLATRDDIVNEGFVRLLQSFKDRSNEDIV